MAAVLEHPDLPKVKDSYRRAVTLLSWKNQERVMKEDSVSYLKVRLQTLLVLQYCKFDPILISLVRRAMPNLIAYDIAVQPMTGPTGLIFAMRSRYTSQTGTKLYLTKQTQISLVEMLL